MNITETSKALFIALVEDAGNWSGTPLVDGNVQLGKEGRGNLTQLKKAGLVSTFAWDGDMWVQFEDAGKAYARELGLDGVEYL